MAKGRHFRVISDNDSDKDENKKRDEHGKVIFRFRKNRRFKQYDLSNIKLGKWVYLLLFLALSALVAVLIFVGIRSFSYQYLVDLYNVTTIGTVLGDGFPIELAGNSVTRNNFTLQDDEILVLSDTALQKYSSDGKVVATFSHGYSNPQLLKNDSRSIVYNMGNKNFMIIDNNQKTRENSADANIIGGAISKNNRYAFLTLATEYFSSLYVYKQDGTPQFNYNFYDSYAIDVALNDNASKGAVVTLLSNDGGLTSNVFIFDFNNANPLYTLSFPDELVQSIMIVDTFAIAQTENNIYIISLNTGKMNTVEASPYYVAFIKEYNGEVITALSAYDDDSESLIYILDLKSGKSLGQASVKGNLVDLSQNNDKILVMTRESLYLFDKSLMKRNENFTPVSTNLLTESRASILSSGDRVYTMTIGEILSYTVKREN